MTKKSAFTLAELMVVLAILGVVGAVTMPILKQASPNQNKVLAKKAYMVTAQIVEDMINDENLYPEYSTDGVTHYEGFDNTAEAKSCSGSTKFSCLFKTYLNGDVSGNYVTTSDGIKWSVGSTTSGSTGKTTVTVDVAADTASTTNNPDTFTMTVRNDGQITINEDWAKKAIKLGTKNHLN